MSVADMQVTQRFGRARGRACEPRSVRRLDDRYDVTREFLHGYVDLLAGETVNSRQRARHCISADRVFPLININRDTAAPHVNTGPFGEVIANIERPDLKQAS